MGRRRRGAHGTQQQPQHCCGSNDQNRTKRRTTDWECWDSMTAASWDFSRFNVIEWRFSISAHCQWGKRGDVDGARTDGLGNVGCPFGGGELVFPVWITLLLA